MKKVMVASKNPVKINATKSGFEKMFPEESFEFQGVSVSVDVSDQPMSDEETLNGALSRSEQAKIQFPNADFWVGIEGGVDKLNDTLFVFAWIVISSKELIGKSRTGNVPLPKKIDELIQKNIELGDAVDIVFGHTNSKQKNGAVGCLTNNLITREYHCSESVILALIPFKNSELYLE